MRAFQTLRLRLLIILPFSCLFILAAVIFIALSYLNNKSVASSMGHQFAQELSNRILARVDNLTEVLPKIININAGALQKGLLDAQQPQTMSPWLLNQIRHFEHLNFITVALSDGRYIAAYRDMKRPDALQISANFVDGPFQLTGYIPTADDHIGEPVLPYYAYDSRQRPFMQCALQHPASPCWGDIYRYVGIDSFAVSLSRAVTNQQGEIIGVTAVDMSFQQLNEFMASLNIGEGSYAFLAEQDGTLIATSNAGLPAEHGDDHQRWSLDQHPHPLFQAVSQYRQQHQTHGNLQVGDKTYLLNIRQIDLGHGLSWQLGILLPKQDFLAPITGKNRDTLLITLATLLTMILIGGYLARVIANPIENISELAKRQALDELEKAPFKRSFVPEVRKLSVSLAFLARELGTFIRELEERVQARTEQLQAANIQLQALSELDGLTGIANRRAFDKTFSHEWAQARRSQTPLSLILCDIDHFKSFNDHFGHQAGDEALRRVATCLAEQLHRPGDLLARYGGEEFVAVLPDTTASGALELAEKLRAAVENMAISRDDLSDSRCVTLSFGVASQVPQQHDDPQKLLRLADQQLYAAKAHGRNRCCSVSVALAPCAPPCTDEQDPQDKSA
ncbi:MAG: sensor domain-containing diguanylate cyclase [Gammaproteobacteria bacterium]|nr:sensor domain-containing diguanylate cyclase [Gammaproteobacteria bacterium]